MRTKLLTFDVRSQLHRERSFHQFTIEIETRLWNNRLSCVKLEFSVSSWYIWKNQGYPKLACRGQLVYWWAKSCLFALVSAAPLLSWPVEVHPRKPSAIPVWRRERGEETEIWYVPLSRALFSLAVFDRGYIHYPPLILDPERSTSRQLQCWIIETFFPLPIAPVFDARTIVLPF